MCFLPICFGRQVRWMHQPGSHRRKVTQDFSSIYSTVVYINYLGSLCVCLLPINSGHHKFVGRTSRGHTGGRSHRIFHPSSFCGARLSFSREKDSAFPFPRRLWSRILFTYDLIVLHPLGIIFVFSIFYFFKEKYPFTGIELTSQRVRCGRFFWEAVFPPRKRRIVIGHFLC